jgi:hypothetical protein
MTSSFMEKNTENIFNRDDDRRIRYCQKAPEWAEHARFDDQDEPLLRSYLVSAFGIWSEE